MKEKKGIFTDNFPQFDLKLESKDLFNKKLKNVDKEFAKRISYSIVGFFDEYLKGANYNWTEDIINNYETSIKFK